MKTRKNLTAKFEENENDNFRKVVEFVKIKYPRLVEMVSDMKDEFLKKNSIVRTYYRDFYLSSRSALKSDLVLYSKYLDRSFRGFFRLFFVKFGLQLNTSDLIEKIINTNFRHIRKDLIQEKGIDYDDKSWITLLNLTRHFF